MLTASKLIQHNIRRLRPADQSEVMAHFQRLDRPTRRLRFLAQVTDTYLAKYASELLSSDSIVFGAFPDGELRGVAELRGLHDSWPRSAELALLVEPDWQHAGIGDAMFNRIISAARNRHIRSIQMLCLRENKPMQTLARKHAAVLKFDTGEVEGTLSTPWPTPLSVFGEIFGDPSDYFRSMMHLADRNA
ncbi:Acetyltransferase, GNAT family [Sulfitobacter noctilucae]|uniref:GNAT family N-acetyltransferase n=1 Tax=Sulfitobacter noctilucae TaxID=1342302 RepID=UPI00046905F8|nr:GNAT family N-acetyltransferase [Sulfitobacter noctilucae]KIN70485.1 Acetyltransferase, GNAT family [Sulfitobacter noctilucae]